MTSSLISSKWEAQDAGLLINERDGVDFWRPGEFMQYRVVVKGKEVVVTVSSGRLTSNRGYGVSVNGKRYTLLTEEEAKEIIIGALS